MFILTFDDVSLYMRIYSKKNGLSITYSWQIRFWEHDIEASKMQGRARARKGEAQGVLSYQKVEGSFDNPHIYYIIKYTYDIYIYLCTYNKLVVCI